MFYALKNSSTEIFSTAGTFDFTQEGIYHLMISQFLRLAAVLGPFMLLVMIAGIVSTVVQGGGVAVGGENNPETG